MQLDNMRVAIRPMTTAQAVDLGFMMARHWFFPLWKIWLGMALPVFILYIVLVIVESVFFSDNSYYFNDMALLLFWWLKPVYEKPLVSWLGQALFANASDVKTTIKRGWRSFFQYAGTLLFRQRLSPSRQLFIPILMLENPQNTQQIKQRHRLLQRGQSNAVMWHTLIMVHIEMVIIAGVIFYLYLLIPQTITSNEGFIRFIENLPMLFKLSWAVLCFLAFSVVAPFFICGGFAVYLTKRCLLEGWDIELIFKQLAQRFAQAQENPLSRLQGRKSP